MEKQITIEEYLISIQNDNDKKLIVLNEEMSNLLVLMSECIAINTISSIQKYNKLHKMYDNYEEIFNLIEKNMCIIKDLI